MQHVISIANVVNWSFKSHFTVELSLLAILFKTYNTMHQASFSN